MTVEEILATFPGEAARLRRGERESVGELVTAARIRRVGIGDRRYAVAFLFDPAGGLGAVHLRLINRGGIAPAYDELVAWLSRENGSPDASSGAPPASGAWTRHASWATEESLIDLYGWEAAAQESHVLSLDFSAGEIQPQQQGSVVLTYRPVSGGQRSSK
jgi:hypothetical protein